MKLSSILFKKKPAVVKKAAPKPSIQHRQIQPVLEQTANYGIEVSEVAFDEFDRREILLGKNQSGAERRNRVKAW